MTTPPEDHPYRKFADRIAQRDPKAGREMHQALSELEKLEELLIDEGNRLSGRIEARNEQLRLAEAEFLRHTIFAGLLLVLVGTFSHHRPLVLVHLRILRHGFGGNATGACGSGVTSVIAAVLLAVVAPPLGVALACFQGGAPGLARRQAPTWAKLLFGLLPLSAATVMIVVGSITSGSIDYWQSAPWIVVTALPLCAFTLVPVEVFAGVLRK